GFQASNAFYIEMSDETGRFDAPTIVGSLIGGKGGTTFITIPKQAVAGNAYQIRVRSSNPVTISSDLTAPFSIGATMGQPGNFGHGHWYVSVYKDLNFNFFAGYYSTTSDLNFNTNDHFPALGAPSSASSYDGCTVPNDGFSMRARRKNIPQGYYQIDIPQHEGSLSILLNGNIIYQSEANAENQSNVWTGLLGPKSELEVRVQDGGSNTSAHMTFTDLGLTLMSSNIGKCSTASVPMSVSAAVDLDYTWSPSQGLNTDTGRHVTTSTTYNQTYTVTGRDEASGAVFTKDVQVNILAGVPLLQVTQDNFEICAGESVSLQASNASFYTWSPARGLDTTSGPNVIASPTESTVYTVSADNGCGGISTRTITVKVGPPATVDDQVFGEGKWLAYAYEGDFRDPANLVLKGYYEHQTNGFRSWQRWNRGGSPSDASGYVGCPVNADYHSVSYKRKGVYTGFYNIIVDHNDDAYQLLLDGQVISRDNRYNSQDRIVWRGFLTPETHYEFTWQDYTGGSGGRIRFNRQELIKDLPNTAIYPDPSVCPTDLVLVANTLNYDASTTTFTWTDNLGNVLLRGVGEDYDSLTVSLNPAVTGYTLTIEKDGFSMSDRHTFSFNFDALDVQATQSGNQVCPGTPINLNASGASFYEWRILGAPTLLQADIDAALQVSPTTTTQYVVTGYTGCLMDRDTVTVTIVPVPDASAFPVNYWRADSYHRNGNQKYYRGYYEEYGLDFDSRTTWGGARNGPRNAPGFVEVGMGCNLGNDNHAVHYKRKGFPAGYYQLDIPFHDDQVWLYVDGLRVYKKNRWGYNRINVFTGLIGPETEIELVWHEGGGGSGGSLKFNDLMADTTLVLSPDVAICPSNSTNLSVDWPLAPTATYTWAAPAGINLNANTGAQISATADSGSSGAYDVLCTAFDPVSGVLVTDTVTVLVQTTLQVSISSDVLHICRGESVALKADGANTYTWSSLTPATAGIASNTGQSITVSPTQTTTYTVVGSNGCVTDTESITIQVSNSVRPVASEFGDGVWNAITYTGDIIRDEANSLQLGFYTQSEISFNSINAWAAET
ncbi:MAG: hypothetical protein AAFU64_02275, partial [Bacteroidota bacterium]